MGTKNLYIEVLTTKIMQYNGMTIEYEQIESEDHSEEESNEQTEEDSGEEDSGEEESGEESESSSSSQEELDAEDTTDIRNISIKQVDKEGFFGLGKYGEFEVYLMMRNDKVKGYRAGYINATKLCSSAEKKFPHWLENNNSKKMISAFSVAIGIPEATMMVKIMTSSKSLTQIRGTYVHPDLIPHIASWASPVFAIKVSKIVNQYYISQAIEEKDRLLKKKQDKIDKMSAKIDKILANNQKMLSINAKQAFEMDRLLTKTVDQTTEIGKLVAMNFEQTVQMKKINTRAKRILAKNEEMHEDINTINDKLTVASNARVVPDYGGDNGMLVIVKNNDDHDEYSEDERIYEYHCMRVIKSTYAGTMSKHKKLHPNMKILLNITYSPNSVNLFKRIKEKLRGKIEFDKCRFNLCGRYTEKRLLEDIKKIHDKRFDTKNL